RNELESSHKFETDSDSEIIVHLLGDYYQGSLSEAMSKTVRRLDGVFAIAASYDDELVIARDVVGVKQLYYNENSQYIAFSSERKALWAAGMKEYGKRLPPANLATISSRGIELEKFAELPLKEESRRITDQTEAIEVYIDALQRAVSKRLEDMDNVGMIFSGGIDSVLIAKLVKDHNVDFTCYCAGTDASSDIFHAEDAASRLGFTLKVNWLDMEKIEGYIPQIIETIEDRSLGQIEVAIPIYAAVREAQGDGVKVLLTGQGADELFAGYPWYKDVVERHGYDKLTYHLKDDLSKLYKETLEREDKITMAHSIELRVPYLDLSIVSVSSRIATELKLPPEDNLGKHVHREAALRLGVPEELAFMPKEAAQHGSGVHGLLENLAVSRGFDQKYVNKMGYTSDESVSEVLGSSGRYGNRYSTDDQWSSPDNVQLYLDTITYEEHLTHDQDQVLLEQLLRTE
ncbi:MAG: asparagine synthetase B family protein, partial [Nitrososphaerales archaeon]